MSDVEVTEIVATLKQRVADRRAAGDYPMGLEQQLESHFDAMLESLHDDRTSTDGLRTAVDRLGATLAAVGKADIAATSRAPGGAVIHRATMQLIKRHVQQVELELSSVASAVRDGLTESARLFEEFRSADERELNGVLAMVLDRLAVVDHLSEVVVELEERLRRLEPGPAG